MRILQRLFENNERWATRLKAQDPEVFSRLSEQQSPEFLWIGCSDSRVPANDIVGLMPGELFVHRNVGNVVSLADENCLSVVQYAVEILGVKHIIVCGHYGCGGVRAAMDRKELGLISKWLGNIKDVYEHTRATLDRLPEERRLDRLCELNVIRQVANVCRTSFVQNAWLHGRELSVHGWIYSIRDGMLRDLGVCFTGFEQFASSERSDTPPEALFGEACAKVAAAEERL